MVAKAEDKDYVFNDMRVHQGMIQDSVILGRGESLFGLRYFPYQGNRIEFYAWPEDIKKVFIHNAGEDTITIETLWSNCHRNIEPGETQEFEY